MIKFWFIVLMYSILGLSISLYYVNSRSRYKGPPHLLIVLAILVFGGPGVWLLSLIELVRLMLNKGDE